MRSSKSRSRSKSNRNRPSGGNIVNRVFDSSGPEGKVRGTPQQIIDKYTQLARDAQLSGDRVAFENFQQHSEHYTRMLNEAQREIDAKREQQEREQRDRQANQQQNNQPPNQQNDQQPRPQQQSERRSDDQSGSGDGGVIDGGRDGDESGLVETPENAPAPKPRRQRRPRGEKPSDDGSKTGPSDNPDTHEAAE